MLSLSRKGLLSVIVVCVLLSSGLGVYAGYYAGVRAPSPNPNPSQVGDVLTLDDIYLTGEIYQGAGGTALTNAIVTKEASYTVWKDGATYYALNGQTGETTSNADAYTIIQGAITAMEATGDYHTLFLKKADYVLTAGLVISKVDNIEGESGAVLFKAFNGAVITVNDSDVNLRLKNIVIDGNKGSGYTGDGIAILSSSIYINDFETVSTRNCKGNGITLSATGPAYISCTTLHNVISQDNDGCGIYIGGATFGISLGPILVSGNGLDGIRFETVAGNKPHDIGTGGMIYTGGPANTGCGVNATNLENSAFETIYCDTDKVFFGSGTNSISIGSLYCYGDPALDISTMGLTINNLIVQSSGTTALTFGIWARRIIINYIYVVSGDVTGIDSAGGPIFIHGTNPYGTYTKNTMSSGAELIPATLADHYSSGSYGSLTVGESVTIGQVLFVNNTDGKLWKADATDNTTIPAVVIACGSITADNAGYVLNEGYMRDDSWSWAPGGILYLSETAGAMTQTPPAGTGKQVQVLGYALTADIIYFSPNLMVLELS